MMEKLKQQLEKLEQEISAGKFTPMTTSGRQKSPNLVRSAIRNYCLENDLALPKFRQMINVNSASFNKFMSGKYQNPWSATGNSTYLAASSFLAVEALRSKIAKKEGKAGGGQVESKSKGESGKSSASSKEERKALVEAINAVDLEGDAVFDDCNVVRAKINACIKKHGFTMSALGKSIGVNAGSISRFLSQKGEGGGAANGCYTAAYQFFEKQRLLEKLPKSAARLAAEKEQGASGFSLSHTYSESRWAISDTASTNKRAKSAWTMDAENTRPNKMGRYPNPRAGF